MFHDPEQSNRMLSHPIVLDLEDPEPASQPGEPEDYSFPFDDEPTARPEEPRELVFEMPGDPEPTKRTRTVGTLDLETGQYTEIEEPIEPKVAVDSVLPSQADLPLVEARVLLERPFFALSAKPIPALHSYTDPKNVLHLNVTAADPARGVATIADADILIVVTSLMNSNLGPGGRVEPQVRLPAAVLLHLCRRQTGGRQHRLLEETLNRLRDTRITMNIGPTGKAGPVRRFSLLADWSRQGRTGLTLTASDWLVEAVKANALLSLSRDYFHLPRGYARWLYRTARKHAGRQADGIAMRLSTLRMKSGSTSPPSRFNFELKRLVMADQLPDYWLTWIPAKPGREPMVRMRYEPDTVPWVSQREIWEGRTAPEEEDLVLEEELPF